MTSRLTAPAVLVTCLTLVGCDGPFSTLDPAGPAATSVAWLWWAMFGFSTVVLIAVTALWLYAIKRQAPEEESEPAHAQKIQNRWVLWGGFALPVGSITLLLAFGIPIGHSMLPLTPDDGGALRIEVTGHQWWWEVNYPDSDIALTDEVHIPANTPVDIHLASNDVIHSFWVPRLAGKVDMIPGRTNVLRLEADEAGTYRGTCAEFCGVGHAHMQFTVTAHEPDAFSDWKQEMTGGDE